MSSNFPILTTKQMIKIVEKLGFHLARQSGTSHAVYYNKQNGRRTTIPIHGNKDLKRKTIKSICNDINISIDELKNML